MLVVPVGVWGKPLNTNRSVFVTRTPSLVLLTSTFGSPTTPRPLVSVKVPPGLTGSMLPRDAGSVSFAGAEDGEPVTRRFTHRESF